MKAVACLSPLAVDDPDCFVDLDVSDPPAPEGHDLLVRVEAVSVNPVDYKMRQKADPVTAPHILGWDAAGTVAAAGPLTQRFVPGDAVFYAGSLFRQGCNAELHLVDERLAGPKPASLTMAEAAALPLTAITAWELMFDRIGLSRGQNGVIVVIGAAGGVGSMAVQLARRLTKMTVIGTASRPETAEWVRRMGAHHVIDHSRSLAPQVADLASGGADCVLCLTATEVHFDAIAELIAPQGRLGLIADPLAPIDITKLKRKSASIHWAFMSTRPLYETVDMDAQGRILAEIAGMVDDGVLHTTMTEMPGRLDATTLRRAHGLLETGRTIGKLVLGGIRPGAA